MYPVPTEAKQIRKKTYFCCHHWRKEQDPKSEDPDLYQNVTDPEHRFLPLSNVNKRQYGNNLENFHMS